MNLTTLPRTANQARDLEWLLSEPLNADIAMSALNEIFLPEELKLDLIISRRNDPKTDVRELIRCYLADTLQTRQHVVKFWEEEAVDILDRICQNLTLEEARVAQETTEANYETLIALKDSVLNQLDTITEEIDRFEKQVANIKEWELDHILVTAKLLNKRLKTVVR